MKRASVAAREENYEHVLMCLICRSLFDEFDHQPKFLPCHHTFCKDCLREYVRQMGDEIECPSCRKIANIPAAGVAALQTNFYVKYIQSLVSGSGGICINIKECSRHADQQPQFYCQQCQLPICKVCCTNEGSKSCFQHLKTPLTTATEESHQNLDSAFSRANATIEAKKKRLETMLKNLSEEKDQSLRKIDSTFEGHVHTLHRRATLLKNKVIDIYKENVENLENDLMEISTALTCIVSLKDYHENKISNGDFREINKGIEEIDEVNGNISERIKPQENHIVFEESHGTDKFKGCVKDLGRVRCTRPSIPRTEPEGFDAGAGASGGLNTPRPEDKSPMSETSKPCTPCEEVKSPGEEATSGEQGSACASSATVIDNSANRLIIPEPEGASDSPPPPPSPVPPQVSREAYMNGTMSPHAEKSQPRDGERIPSFVAGDNQAGSAHDTSDSGKVEKDDSQQVSDQSGEEKMQTPSHSSKLPKPSKGSKSKGGPRPMSESKRSTHMKDGTRPKDIRTKESSSKNKDGGRGKEGGKKGKGGSRPPSNTATPIVTSPPDTVPQLDVLPQKDKEAAAPESLSKAPLPCHNGTGCSDVNRLRTEKDYYHTVYTSYDEEELLKELKTGKGSLTDDSDNSWLTISSGDESQSGTTTLVDDVIIENEITSL